MASAMLKLMVLIICINTFMYIGTTYANTAEGIKTETTPWYSRDLFDLLLEDREGFEHAFSEYAKGLGEEGNMTRAYALKLSGNLSRVPTTQTGSDTAEPTSGGFWLFDALAIIWGSVATLFKIAVMPITLFTMGTLPLPLVVIIGIPLALLNLVVLIGFIRGAMP